MRFDDITYRPIDVWPGTMTPEYERRRAPFSSEWYSTMRLLERELDMLGARRAIFQVALEERDFRIDGKPRAQARAAHPGVILAFESRYGPVKFAVDTFTTWQANVRAIALGMEALRKVDRYGVTQRGEQYTGFRALPASTDPADQIVTEEQASALAGRYMVPGEDDLRSGIRKGLMATHPDRGGDPDEFRRVLRAKEILGV